MNVFSKITGRLFSSEVKAQVRAALAIAERDSTFSLGARSMHSTDRDRYPYDRGEILDQALEAWRVNPLARRIVGLTTQYVVGGGIVFTCKHQATLRFLNEFWHHRLNHLSVRGSELCDELTRTGNLFILLSTDAAGMSYIRSIPTAEIDRIESRPNDIEQELFYYPKPTIEQPDPEPWSAYNEAEDSPGPDGHFKPVMLHYAINRPVGAQWGESDLAPVLRWLARYANWLEDRARLNRFRNAFLYVVKGAFASEAERIARQQLLNANPPGPGSILVCDNSETWEVIAPQLEASDANTDGLALKKMISAGAGVPLHFLAEPESSTRTTAEAAGGPTYRHYEQRQQFFMWLIKDILEVTLNRRALVDKRISRRAELIITGSDISARDNVSLGMAATNIHNVFKDLRDRQLIDDSELLRIVYRFGGETTDIEDMLAKGKAAGPSLAPASKGIAPVENVVDAETGETKEKIESV